MQLDAYDPYDDTDVADALALDRAIQAYDEPWQHPPIPQVYTAFSRHGWDGEPNQHWLLREEGRAIGKLSVYLPKRDNLHRAGVGVGIHPEHRRRGHGTRLLDEGLRLAREAGRRLVTSSTVDAPGPNAFVQQHGFAKASVEIQRRQDLATADRTRIEKLRAAAAEKAAEYTLLHLVDAVSDELVDDVAALTAAINDAPTDDFDVEDEVFDAARIRAFEHTQAVAGLRLYRVIARKGTDGPFAGHTIVAVHPDRPEHAEQYDTSVLAAHRGHRLGMLLKADMLTWLAEVEPGIRQLDTWNAESNAHMIAVNEQLGYQIIGRYLGYQRSLDDS